VILALDFGGQYCHLIGRRIREQEVYSKIVPHDITPKEIETLYERFRKRKKRVAVAHPNLFSFTQFFQHAYRLVDYSIG